VNELRSRLKKSSASAVSYAVISLGTLIVIYPFLWTFLMSLRTNQEIFADPWGMPTNPAWENYAVAWTQGNLGVAAWNSAIITVASILVLALISPITAYALSKPIFGRRILF